MPRKAKDEELNTTKKSATKKAASSKKSAEAVKQSKSKKVSTTKKASTVKKASSRKSTSASVKKVKASKTTKTVKAKSTAKAKVSMAKPVEVEYYDLPHIYDKTIVKILAQTPSCLFAYWEISAKDRELLQKKYGEGFFQDTKPYLVITNETMNYTFEIEVNDYANSWYVHINDSDCKYSIKLIRKPISKDISIPFVNITSSNEMDAPNDHILFDKLGKTVFFRNVKTNVVNEKDISSISFINNIGRIYNIYDLYKEIYKNELDGDELGTNLSSSQFSSCYR